MASWGKWVLGVALLVVAQLSLNAEAQTAPHPPPGTVDIRNEVGNGRIGLVLASGQWDGFWLTARPGPNLTVNPIPSVESLWWVGSDTGPTNAVTLFNNQNHFYLAHTGSGWELDISNAYPTGIWWYFYEVPGTNLYKIGTTLGNKVGQEFISFNNVFTRDGADSWRIAPWGVRSATELPALDMQQSLPLDAV